MTVATFARVLLCFALLSCSLQRVSNADIDTSPYKFSDQAIAATGSFEWDEMAGSVNFGTASGTVDSADVSEFGGNAALGFTYTINPMDGPPFPVFTSTENIYAGGTFVDYAANFTSLDTTNANTTVVAQFGVVGFYDPASFLLDGNAATDVFFRGTVKDVLHNIDNGSGGVAFDVNYFWAEWQVGADADYTLSFGSNPHQSLAQLRVDYYNTATVFDAIRPSTVPEPTSMLVLGFVGSLATLRRRRLG